MKLWKTPLTVERLNELAARTIHEALHIRFTEVGENFVEAEMPVESRVHRPGGYLHGGASVVLAESVASVASLMCVDTSAYECFGVTIHANHLRAATAGKVIARATPIKIGASLHVWEIRLRDQDNKNICAAQLTVAVVSKRS